MLKKKLNEQTYTSQIHAARALLFESTATLQEHGVDFVIVGGWIPYLFNSRIFGHPGTFDVDVLLSDKSKMDGSFESAIQELLGSGYMLAAKNRFQVHRVFKVGKEEQQTLFHVDFLHSDHKDAERLDPVSMIGPVGSIHTEIMHLVYKCGLFESRQVKLDLPDQETLELSIPFATEPAFLASKARSVQVRKRVRDPFDIFVTIKDSLDGGRLRDDCRRLISVRKDFQNAMEDLRTAFSQDDVVDRAFFTASELNRDTETSFEKIRESVLSFIQDIGLNDAPQPA